MNYAPRITFPYARLASWISRVSLACEKVIFYEHSGDPQNVHVHGLILGFRKDKGTLKNWLKEALGVKPTKNEWRFPEQQVNGEPLDANFIAYMSKGKYDPVYNKGFTLEEIAEQKAKGYVGKKNDEKPDKNTMYWNGLEKDVAPQLEYMLERYSGDNEALFEFIRTRCYAYMMNHVSLPMPHDIARHRACVMRLCWEYSIPVSPKASKYLV